MPHYVVDATETVLRSNWSPADLESLTTDQTAVLYFLYSKQLVLSHEKSLAMAIISDPDSATYARVHNLLTRAGDRPLVSLPDDWMTFEKFAASTPWEREDTSTVFFRDVVPKCVVYRAGTGPLAGTGPSAAAAAAVVAWHYIQCLQKGRSDVAVTDVTTFVRNHLPRTELVRYVFDGVLRPTRMLEVLCDSSELYTEAVSGLTASEIEHRFVDHGPLLLSNIKATRALLEKEVASHFKPPSPTEFMDAAVPRHTGVIVGFRRSGGDTAFLVQCFWRQKQFYECNLAFLQGSEALVSTLLEKTSCTIM